MMDFSRECGSHKVPAVHGHARPARTGVLSRQPSTIFSAAGQRWRMGSATHWRSMLMQR